MLHNLIDHCCCYTFPTSNNKYQRLSSAFDLLLISNIKGTTKAESETRCHSLDKRYKPCCVSFSVLQVMVGLETKLAFAYMSSVAQYPMQCSGCT